MVSDSIIYQLDVFPHGLFGSLALEFVPRVELGAAFKISKAKVTVANISLGTLLVKGIELQE